VRPTTSRYFPARRRTRARNSQLGATMGEDDAWDIEISAAVYLSKARSGRTYSSWIIIHFQRERIAV